MTRKQRHAARVEEVVRQFSDMQEEGSGRWKMSILSCVDVLNWFVGGGELDEDMAECFSVIGPAIRRLSEGERFDCLLCGLTITIPMVFVVLRALALAPKAALLNGLCDECAMLPDNHERIFAFYRKHIMPDFRKVPTADMPPWKI